MPLQAKIRSFQLRPFLSTDLSFPRAGAIAARHIRAIDGTNGASAQMGFKVANGFSMETSLYPNLLDASGDTLRGTSTYIHGVLNPQAFFVLRNEEASCELERALNKRETLYLEKHKAGSLADLAIDWQRRLTSKLKHLEALETSIGERHAKLDKLYSSWQIQRYTPDGTPDGGPVPAKDYAYKPETHSEYLKNAVVEREGDFPWDSPGAETVSSVITKNKSLPVGTVNIGSHTNINAVTTGAQGEEERKHKHISSPTFNLPTSGLTEAAAAALATLPLPIDDNGAVTPATLALLVSVIGNLKRYVAQESETFYPTNRSTRFNEDARCPWEEELSRWHRELSALEEEIIQQQTYNRRLAELERIWTLELKQMELDAKRAMLAYADSFLTSPIAGTVTHVYKDAGEYVQAGEPIMRVESSDHFLLVGVINCHQPVRLGMVAVVKLLNVLEDGGNIQLKGSVVSIRGHDSDNDEWEVVVELDKVANLLDQIPLNYTFDRGSYQMPEAEMTLT
ncbi:HlyD family efflux transporter periplasmic adaptor subunit [Brevifollis gellanilyticus]|uniref:RND efflux pump membrane fusion protein barrel-sandwich domain-containing protein n=1 Tax=Brevifollis gellanilyticus TaxID=748831 RepID=A0A512MBN8_9BACT|nr:HlyD family secretion protein [Brevifollis gellanilyticus]GEP44143.1 hypothetical protein BGE01nite_34340 [Brevifollis gellanilyticus]